MSDTSRGRVTITLGRSGQVVKRGISAADASMTSAGTKRSVRDRIGNNADSSMWHGNGPSSNKRQRGDISMQNGLDDGYIGKDDLRLKLMQKSAIRRAESDRIDRHVDLREKLSKTAPPPTNNFNSKQHVPSRETSLLRPIPSTRTSDDLIRGESMRSSYSPWTLDHIRKRSPDGFPSTSRGISPQRNVGDLQRGPLNRTYDGVRSVPFVGRGVLETSRPPSATPASFMSRPSASTLPPVTAKPVASHPGQHPPPSNVGQRPSYVGDEPQSVQTVDGLLQALGLQKYCILFKAEELVVAVATAIMPSSGVEATRCYDNHHCVAVSCSGSSVANCGRSNQSEEQTENLILLSLMTVCIGGTEVQKKRHLVKVQRRKN